MPSASTISGEGSTVSVRAGREVILAGGAINSPQLLMLSGIGDADELASFDIPVVAHLPGVGRNLQDHLEIYVQHACTRPISLYAAQKPWHKLRIGLEWLLLKRGLGATSHFEAGAFIRSRAGVEHPDLQYHFLPIAMNYDGSNPQQTHGFQAHVGPMRPTSVGHVRLRSADPKEPPSILFNYMATEGDRQEMRAAVRLTREIFAQRAFDPYLGPELAPGAEVGTDAEIDAFVRARAESAYHACGTCKMGPDSDPSAVVDGDVPRPRHRGPARGRRLDHAEHRLGQPERAYDHARREGVRPDPRPRAARSARRARLHRAELGDQAAVGERHTALRRRALSYVIRVCSPSSES